MTEGNAAGIRVCFVCTGNICRSPMAEVMARDALRRAGLAELVTVSSAGTSDLHAGEAMDPRAAAELAAAGLDAEHRASGLTARDMEADLVVALDSGHATRLRRSGVEEGRLRLLRSFDPDAPGQDVPDPYYGDRSDFAGVRAMIAAALPGLVGYCRELVGS